MKTVKEIPIDRMDCPTCIPALERAVEGLEGVDSVRGNYLKRNIKVTYESERTRSEDIESAIEDLGYRIRYKKYPGILERIRGLFSGEEAGVEVIDDEEFKEGVLDSEGLSVVLFSSSTCPGCRVFKPKYKELAEDHPDARFYEMDIGSTEAWREYEVMSIPTVITFRNGKEVGRVRSVLRKEEVDDALRS